MIGSIREDDTGRRLYLEDLHVGQRFLSGTHALDERQVVAFASQFDPQAFHTDPAAATSTFFGGLVASGWHTAAITMRLLVTSSLPVFGGMIGVGAELTWPQPTLPDDVLQVETEVIDIRPSRSRPDRGIVRTRSQTRNQRGEVVQVLVSTLIVPRRSPSDS
jgi:acyl dehydratase